MQREFEQFLDREWPLWRDPDNQGSLWLDRLTRAFAAGVEMARRAPGAPANVSDRELVSRMLKQVEAAKKYARRRAGRTMLP